MSSSTLFRKALAEEQPLQIMGTINAYCARMAERVGYRAIYLSGAGCANASYGIPDVGKTTLQNVLEDARRICGATPVPLLVDIDTGWEDPGETISEMIKAGVAAAHLEDQIADKQCGHLDGKQCVAIDEMVKRLQSASHAKKNTDFYLIARTDAMASEGLSGVIQRATAYLQAGANAIFAEAFSTLEDYRKLVDVIHAPVLANITEFGKTPLFTVSELKKVGVQMVLYPLSAFRAMNQAALTVFETVRKTGTQRELICHMQDRKTLYDFLDYR